ncbi:MoaD/ThiS family protein [Actinotalea sp. C106]|uniref:MoaD/ThiS family protein n=1 Tax=Actinotalea sp. C106 TaxID=2908644 RepID=UPI0020290F6A|nr:MoaD/ThiS family protein [Actinotalea sp. C106]
MVTVRYFAGAAEAAGRASEQVASGTTAGLRRELVTIHGQRLEAVLGRCSLLSAGRRLSDEDEVLPGATVDVLPPFAGG